MKFLHLDSLGGAAGDMLLGVWFELGLEPAALQTALEPLNLGPFTIRAERVEEHHLAGTRVFVDIPEHDHHTAPHSPAHAHRHGRRWSDIRALLEKAPLPEPVRAMSLKVFTRLAEAEGKVHGMPAEAVHFHEVGAVDAIVDIVGNCLALHRLGIEGVSFAPLPLGQGVIRCAHGVFPSPSPATVELLQGFPVAYTEEPHELVTPTGAALLTSWRTHETPPAGSRLIQTAYSFGHRKLDRRPNLLRATLLETAPAGAPERDTCLVLECNVDDTTPELMGALTDRLLEAGALDVFSLPAQMKKQRPGVLLCVLCHAPAREGLLDAIFRGCTTFGVREYWTERTILDRYFKEVQTPYGPVRVKVGRWRGEEVTAAPEMEDCIRLARQHNVSARAVYEAAEVAARARPPCSSSA